MLKNSNNNNNTKYKIAKKRVKILKDILNMYICLINNHLRYLLYASVSSTNCFVFFMTLEVANFL